MNALDGSIPMAREDDEAFARLVAIEGLTYQDAFIESRPGPRPERSNSVRVQASRAAKRTASRRSFLAQQKGAASAPVEVSTEPKAILNLMDEISATLRRAAELATAHNALKLANTIKQGLVRHVGRQNRIVRRVENPCAVRTADDSDVEALARNILEYLS